MADVLLANGFAEAGTFDCRGTDLALFEQFVPEEEDHADCGRLFELVAGLEDEPVVDGIEGLDDGELLGVGELLVDDVVLDPVGQRGGDRVGIELGAFFGGGGHVGTLGLMGFRYTLLYVSTLYKEAGAIQ